MRLRPARSVLALALTLLPGFADAARAEVSADQPAAILVFPKVVGSQDEDTIIQVTNAVGSRVFIRCFYLDGRLDPGGQQRAWQLTDFQITLTPLQPTVWTAGEGLPAVPADSRPRELYPGPVPPVSVGFIGELRCLVVTENESPSSRNALTGEATLINRRTGATRKYRAIGVKGLPDNNGDNTLLLNDAEYSTCPRVLLLNHFFDDAPDPILSTAVRSSLTLVPCSMDLQRVIPGSATVQFEVFNEFEDRFSVSLSVVCFEDLDLSSIDSRTQPALSIFNFARQGTLVGHTRIRPVVDADSSHGHGILAIAEEFRDDRRTGSALNLHFIGGNLQADVMILPTPF